MLKKSKNLQRARERLLCSSSIAYIFLASPLCPAGYTLTRHILEHALELTPSPHTCVHLDVTSWMSALSSSPPCSEE